MPGFNPGFGIGYGFSTIVWIIAVIIVGGIIWRGRRNNYVPGTLMVLSRFRINEDPSAKVGVEIVGRASGLVSWVMTLLRLEPEVEFVVTESEVTIRTASLSGIQHICVPLHKVTASVCTYQRSMLALGFVILFSLGFVMNLLSGVLGGNRNEMSSDMAQAFGFLIFAAIAALVFFLSKRIAIVVETMHHHGVIFKRSVIENVSVDLPQALQAIAVINARLLASRVIPDLLGASPRPVPLPTTAATPPAGTTPGSCPRCSTVNSAGTRFCENCGAALPG